MNRMKKALAVILTVALMVPSMGVAAASVTAKDIAKEIGTTATATASFTGADQILKFTVGGKVFEEGKDFVIDGVEPTAVGTHTIKIKGTGLYEGTTTVTYTITKATKPVVTISAKAAKAVAKKVNAKKKKVVIKLGVKTPVKTKITYTVKVKKALKKYITVSKAGKVTIKKGAKKGTYKVVINVKGTKSFKGVKKTITIKVK